ncbi:MAG: glycoside hydrolase family 2 TIM barrel-domain containing protein [Paludisphaera borealis]|uniref:glycoside hydrolase family 2 protein n=1 Tax=Paludisphaera borealis TaxID=1387353 RepID=UPI00284BDC6F|nr:sugar-binding domain-containing protein [Paludisphaera borealis]MDR3619128.1 glycoside hydrolase family 2 TIM barrel-domain containing protein [Paludisphaera borealis]
MKHASLTFMLLAGLPALSRADDAPKWHPVKGTLQTRWAAQVDPAKALDEYPRPQMVRPSWMKLNGLWQYAIQSNRDGRPAVYEGNILVPFPVESSLSGVKRSVSPDQRLWYRRTFSLPKPPADTRYLLHFGAVDWHATVYVNGDKVGEHKGGFDPFSFDVTDFLDPEKRPQEIIVSVWDPTDSASQPRGKQVLKPEGIWYTANTGIWQTVWLEPVPTRHVESLKIVPDVDAGEVRITPRLSGADSETTVTVTVLEIGKTVGETTGRAGSTLTIKVPDAKLWSPDRPFLYDLRVAIKGGDQVHSYFGMRKIALAKDAAGVNRLFLNNQPLFQAGPLDQGWWPDGLYTAPTDEALKYDLEITKQLGFNMVRKHVKVEPARWYRHCDTMGLLVWQDMPSADNKDEASHAQFAAEWERIIDALHNHPSVVMWVPFNEGWGQHDTPRVVEWTKKHDPTRLVNNASGWTDKGVGDVNDMHNYPGPGMPPVEAARAAVLGEFGGLGLPLAGHLWVDKNNWGYKTFPNQAELTKAYIDLNERLRGLAALGLGASVYTQTTDVEIEVNGLMTYDRAVLKVPVDSAAAVLKPLYQTLPAAKVLAATSQTTPQTWKYTTNPVGPDWAKPDFDDASWSSGPGGFGAKGTPGAVVHTEWKTNEIHLRREFQAEPGAVDSLLLSIHHDEDAEVYLNGVLVSKQPGHVGDYQFLPLDRKAVEALKPGRNVLAVSCRQTAGGQYIDVGLIEIKSAPPATASAVKP